MGPSLFLLFTFLISLILLVLFLVLRRAPFLHPRALCPYRCASRLLHCFIFGIHSSRPAIHTHNRVMFRKILKPIPSYESTNTCRSRLNSLPDHSQFTSPGVIVRRSVTVANYVPDRTSCLTRAKFQLKSSQVYTTAQLPCLSTQPSSIPILLSCREQGVVRTVLNPLPQIAAKAFAGETESS